MDCGGSECVCKANRIILQLTEACQIFTHGIGNGGYYPTLGAPETNRALELMQRAGVEPEFFGTKL